MSSTFLYKTSGIDFIKRSSDSETTVFQLAANKQLVVPNGSLKIKNELNMLDGTILLNNNVSPNLTTLVLSESDCIVDSGAVQLDSGDFKLRNNYLGTTSTLYSTNSGYNSIYNIYSNQLSFTDGKLTVSNNLTLTSGVISANESSAEGGSITIDKSYISVGSSDGASSIEVTNGDLTISGGTITVDGGTLTIPPSVEISGLIPNDLYLKHAIYFDENTASDLTGNSTVTLHGNPTIDDDGIHLLRDTSTYASFSSNHGGVITLAMWIKIDDDSFHTGDYNWNILYRGANFDIQITPSGKLKAHSREGPEGQFGWVDYNPHQWYHLVIVIEGPNIIPKWYMDGTRTYGSSNWSFSGNLSGKITRNIDLGLQTQCVIKSVNIWERALSAEEISDLYSKGRYFNARRRALPIGNPFGITFFSNVLLSNANGEIDISEISNTKLQQLLGINTSQTIQTQLDGKLTTNTLSILDTWNDTPGPENTTLFSKQAIIQELGSKQKKPGVSGFGTHTPTDDTLNKLNARSYVDSTTTLTPNKIALVSNMNLDNITFNGPFKVDVSADNFYGVGNTQLNDNLMVSGKTTIGTNEWVYHSETTNRINDLKVSSIAYQTTTGDADATPLTINIYGDSSATNDYVPYPPYSNKKILGFQGKIDNGGNGRFFFYFGEETIITTGVEESFVYYGNFRPIEIHAGLNNSNHRIGVFRQHTAGTSNLGSQYTFTGQHPCLAKTKFITEDKFGLIVSSMGQYVNSNNGIKASVNESLPICELTTIEKDKKVFGVISDEKDENEERGFANGTFESIIRKTNVNEKRLFINSLGEGSVWVSNKNGPIKNGDYICSSSITGYGQKQDDIYLARFTVAKITCDCEFSLEKIVRMRVKTNINENGKRELCYSEDGSVLYEEHLDKDGNKIMVYPHYTRFIDENGDELLDQQEYETRKSNGENVYIACFLGCTYHCG